MWYGMDGDEMQKVEVEVALALGRPSIKAGSGPDQKQSRIHSLKIG